MTALQQAEIHKCRQCKYQGQATLSLRQVTVRVGWASSQITTIAPTLMCRRCGYVEVRVEWEIGPYVPLEPVSNGAPEVEGPTDSGA